ncbi:MAG: P-II family nitrogen regulator [Candidatus Methanomethylophilaceae archaeon]
MKKIEAVIRPERLDEVKGALEAQGVVGMTITEVQGRGRQKGFVRKWRGTEYAVDFIPKLKMEIVVDDEDAQMVVDTILDIAKTGKIGDGKIFVSNIEEVIRVSSGETGRDAI